MKAEELMIGDWVECTYWTPSKQLKVAEIRRIMDDEIKIGVFCDDLVLIFRQSEVKPIPLTPEVLERNGFNLLKDAYRMSDPFWSYSNRSVLVDVTIIRTNNVKVIDWFNIKVSTRNDIKQVSIWGVKYIHELQHALRLCGITREIII